MFVTSLLCAIGLAAAAPQTIRFEELQWMHGHWLDRGDFPRQGPRWSELFWTGPAGWQMFGVGRTHEGFDIRWFEYLRLEQEDDGIVLYLSPDGAPSVPYRLVRAGAQEAVFENAEAAGYQRIVYRREGDRLTVIHSRSDGWNAERTFMPYEEAVRTRGNGDAAREPSGE